MEDEDEEEENRQNSMTGVMGQYLKAYVWASLSVHGEVSACDLSISGFGVTLWSQRPPLRVSSLQPALLCPHSSLIHPDEQLQQCRCGIS